MDMDTTSMIASLRMLLEELDTSAEGDEALEDLNAELEDTIMLIEDDEDDEEALADAMEELNALVEDYRRCAKGSARISALAARLEMLCWNA